MQEGSAWKLDKFEAILLDQNELLGKRKGAFHCNLERFVETGEIAKHACRDCDTLAKSDEQERLWLEIQPAE